jgi:hypothetical protein
MAADESWPPTTNSAPCRQILSTNFISAPVANSELFGDAKLQLGFCSYLPEAYQEISKQTTFNIKCAGFIRCKIATCVQCRVA